MSRIKIRLTKSSDYKEISHILRESGLVENWFTKKLFEKLLKRNKGFYFVAEDNGKVVGTAFASHDGGYFGHLYKLAVLPEYRRKGIAKKLIKARVKALNKIGIDFIFSHVWKYNKASIATLKSAGFKLANKEYDTYYFHQ